MAGPLQQPRVNAWVRLCLWLWKRRELIWGGIIFGVALNLFATWLTTPSGSMFSNTPLGTILGHPTLSASVGVSLLILTGGLWLINRQYPAPASQNASIQYNREALVRLLRQEYSKRLAQSLQGTAMIALGMHERTDVTRSSAQLIFRRTNIAHTSPLLPGTSIIQAYDDAGKGFLILGGPGAGKTTLLLDLARELLIRAESNLTHPIPVILNLSSWVSKKPPLAVWLIDQLRLVYGIPSRLGQLLLEQDHWLLLLDGLDEVEASARNQCIEAINLYHEEHFAPLVVCSRSHDYVTQKARLALPSAVEIQPLQEQEVMEYLKRIGKPMAAVRAALRTNPILNQLLATPLMLNVVILTYRDKAIKDLSKLGSVEEQQRQIFTRYVEGMLERQTTRGHFTSQQTCQWLAWLAQNMKQRHLTEFYLERLQPSWLPTRRSQIFYATLEGLDLVLISGLVVGIFVKLSAGLISGLISGLLVVVGLELTFVFLHGSRQFMMSREIRPQEILRWSWSWKHTQRVFISIFIVSLYFWFLLAPHLGIIDGLLVSLLSCLFWVPFSLFEGLSSKQIDENMRVSPNQGIHSSGWNALRISLIAWLLGALLGGLVSGLLGGWPTGLAVGPIAGLCCSLTMGIRFGVKEYREHYLLRYVLWQRGEIPWFYVRFLEDCCERILLQRVGGGYRFIHPLFQDYFASLGIRTSPSSQLQSPLSQL